MQQASTHANTSRKLTIGSLQSCECLRFISTDKSEYCTSPLATDVLFAGDTLGATADACDETARTLQLFIITPTQHRCLLQLLRRSCAISAEEMNCML